MKLINDTFYHGERSLFGSRDLELNNVQFFPGESALKESSNISATNCIFMGRYPFWHNTNVKIDDCHFEVYCRAGMWYCKNIEISNSKSEAPKILRECGDIFIRNSSFYGSAEFGWNCSNGNFESVVIEGADYAFMNGKNLKFSQVNLSGKYTFQYTKDIEIRDCVFDTKDAFWHSENVTVYNSTLKGHYLGWYSKNLRLVNCKITGEQPLCYAEGLVLEKCEMIDTDLCFEHSSLMADISTSILSVKNPCKGEIRCQSIGELIIDDDCRQPGGCKIIENI